MPAIYPPRPANRRLAWPANNKPVAPPPRAPLALVDAAANLSDLDISGWTFEPGPRDDKACVQVSLELGTLCRLLTCPCSQDERNEWARRLVLQAQERLPDSALKHLFSSIGRESWETARLRKRRETEADTAHAAPASDAGMDREELAAELAHFTASLRRAIATRDFNTPSRAKKATEGTAPDQVEATAFTPDVLRAGKASFGPADEHDSAQLEAPLSPFRSLGGRETAVRYCQPVWEVPEGYDGSRVQATLRFDPGVCHGDTVLVAGPDGVQMRLVTPPGVRNVQRVLASVPAPAELGAARVPEGTEAGTALLLDIVPLGPRAAPYDSLVVDDITIVLPNYAAPFTSLVLALPADADGAATPDAGSSRPPTPRAPPPATQPARVSGGSPTTGGASARSRGPAAAEPRAHPAAAAVVSVNANAPSEADEASRRRAEEGAWQRAEAEARARQEAEAHAEAQARAQARAEAEEQARAQARAQAQAEVAAARATQAAAEREAAAHAAQSAYPEAGALVEEEDMASASSSGDEGDMSGAEEEESAFMSGDWQQGDDGDDDFVASNEFDQSMSGQ